MKIRSSCKVSSSQPAGYGEKGDANRAEADGGKAHRHHEPMQRTRFARIPQLGLEAEVLAGP